MIVAKDDAISRVQFARIVRLKPRNDFEVNFASPEDVIIYKMLFYREGASEKHLRDITGVLSLSDNMIDRTYIESWVARLELTEIWAAILRRMNKSGS